MTVFLSHDIHKLRGLAAISVMVAIGWLDSFMMRNNIPAASFLIAFILGPLPEDNFRQAILMAGDRGTILFRSPITWLFWALTAITPVALSRSGLRQNAAANYLRGDETVGLSPSALTARSAQPSGNRPQEVSTCPIPTTVPN